MRGVVSIVLFFVITFDSSNQISFFVRLNALCAFVMPNDLHTFPGPLLRFLSKKVLFLRFKISSNPMLVEWHE